MNTTPSPTSGERTSGIVDRVREHATAQLSTQKDKATDGLGTVAQAVRQTTQSLRDQQQDTVAQYVDRAADQIERLSERLKNKDVTELLDDAQRLARRQPALFIGGAFAIGLIGARFLKSSSSATEDITMYDRGGNTGSFGSTGYQTGYGSGQPYGSGAGYGSTQGYGSTGYTSGGTTGGYSTGTPAAPTTRTTGLDREGERF